MAESPYSISAVLSVGYANASVSTWTSSTPPDTASILVTNDYSYNTIVVSLNQTTTITGGQVTFQGSLDGTNFFPLQGIVVSTGAQVGPTYNLQASTYAVFSFNLTGIPYFQILLSSAIVGSGSVTIGYAADSFVNQMASTGGSSGNSSVGPNGEPIPLDSTLIGSEDSSGNLQPASATNPLPVVASPAAATGEPPTNVSIALTSTLILAANSLRKGVNICNISFGTVSLAFGIAAVLYTGITLGPGGTFWMDATDFSTAAIYAISSQTNTTMAVQEFE